jgi:hypothetical protein
MRMDRKYLAVLAACKAAMNPPKLCATVWSEQATAMLSQKGDLPSRRSNLGTKILCSCTLHDTVYIDVVVDVLTFPTEHWLGVSLY